MKKKTVVLLLILSFLSLFPLSSRPTVALVLSGGGARGIVHIPIIEELERRGIYPDIVTGTSIGGLVGGLYAAGYTTEELRQFVKTNNISSALSSITSMTYHETEMAYDPFDRNVIALSYGEEGIGSTNALLDDTKINTLLRSLIVKRPYLDSFDDLTYPFRTIGTELSTGDMIVFSSGSLFDAMRSTMSMPVFFPPYITEDGKYIVDGGVVNNFPVRVARDLGADIVIGIDINEDVRVQQGALEYLDTITGVLNQYLNISGQNPVHAQYSEVDYLLIPDTGNINVIDFGNIDALLAVGEKFVEENQEIFDMIEAELAEYLPLEPHGDLYRDLEYVTVESITVPSSLERYTELLKEFEGRVYDEAFVQEFDSLLETLRYRENLRSIGYNWKDGVLTLKTQSNVKLQSVFFGGFTGGLNYTFDYNRRNVFTLDTALSLSTRIRHNNAIYDVGLKFGLQNQGEIDLSIPINNNFFWNAAVGAGFGGYSTIAARFLAERYVTRDWNVNGRTGFYWVPDDYNRLDIGASVDYYYLGGGFGVLSKLYPAWEGSEIWQHRWLLYGGGYLNYHYNDLNDNAFFSPVHNEFQLALNAGYATNRFSWSLQADYSGFFRLKGNNYLDYSATAFYSSYPYEIASSYHVSPLGFLSREYLHADVYWRYNLSNVLSGLYIGIGFFASGDSNTQFKLEFDSFGRLMDDNPSLIPFKKLFESGSYRLGNGLKVGIETKFGTFELGLLVTYRGEVALSLRAL